MSNKKNAQKFFEGNTAANEVHYTSDGFPFTNKSFAVSHATTLEDKEVETFKRTLESDKNEDSSKDPEPKTPAKTAKPKAPAKTAKKTEDEPVGEVDKLAADATGKEDDPVED